MCTGNLNEPLADVTVDFCRKVMQLGTIAEQRRN